MVEKAKHIYREVIQLFIKIFMSGYE